MNTTKLPISVCLIVKNEALTLRKCIDSFISFASEVIINDTGSTDGTHEILNSYPEIQWFETEWKDDFSYSRNCSIEKATQPWILSIDADEVVTNSFANDLADLLHQNVDGFLVTIINYQNEHGLLSRVPHKLVRVFRNKPSIRFQGIIHEQVSTSIDSNRIKESNLQIDHFGYQQLSPEKFRRNITLLNQTVEEEYDNAYSWYQIGVMYFSTGDFKKALRAFNNTLIYEKSTLPYSTLFTLYIKMAQCFLSEKNYAKTEELLQIALHIDIKNPFPYYVRVCYLLDLKKYDNALENLIKVKEFNSGIWKVNDFQIELDFGNLYYLKNNYKDAITCYTNALKLDNESGTACYNLGNCFYKLNMFEEAKEMYSWALTYNPELISAKENLQSVEKLLQGV